MKEWKGEKVMSRLFQTEADGHLAYAPKAAEEDRVYSTRCTRDPSPVPSWLWNGSLAQLIIHITVSKLSRLWPQTANSNLRFEAQTRIVSNIIWGRTSIMKNRYHLITLDRQNKNKQLMTGTTQVFPTAFQMSQRKILRNAQVTQELWCDPQEICQWLVDLLAEQGEVGGEEDGWCLPPCLPPSPAQRLHWWQAGRSFHRRSLSTLMKLHLCIAETNYIVPLHACKHNFATTKI